MTDNGLRIAFPLLLFWVALIVLTPSGLWVPDETVYYAAVHTLVSKGTLVVDNGYGEFAHRALLFNDLLKPTEAGPVPQYPSGFAILSIPAYVLGGIKGMFLMNAVAAAISVVVTHRIARLLFSDERIAVVSALLFAVASFLVIYAKALWPHGLATCIVLASSYFGLKAIRGEAGWSRAAIFCGLILGFGLSVRVDVVLIAPALLVMSLLFAARPLSVATLALGGLVPGALVAAFFNELKFGVFFPVHYGDVSGGGGDLRRYLGLAVVSGIVFVLAALFRGRRFSLQQMTALIAVTLAAVTAIVILPMLSGVEAMLSRLLRGEYTLWFDMRVLGNSAQSVLHPDGTVTVFGLYKKAVAQSMPWIGLIGVLFVVGPGRDWRFGVVFCTVAVVSWSLLFARNSWHGGFSSNMRYFLPVTPFVSMLVAVALFRLPTASKGEWSLAAAAGLVLFLIVSLVAIEQVPQPALAVLQHQVPLLLCLVVSILGLATAASPKFSFFARCSFFATLSSGLFNTYAIDLVVDIERRSLNARSEAVLSALPEGSFVYALIYEPMLFQIRRGDPIAARDHRTDLLDPTLIDEALEKGYPVYVQTDMLLKQVMEARPSLVATRVFEEELIAPVWLLQRD